MADKKTVRGTKITEQDHFHNSDYDDAFDFAYGDIRPAPQVPTPAPKLCIYCNKPWTPRMEQIYLEFGYCESCFDSERVDVIVCDSCNRIVYAK